MSDEGGRFSGLILFVVILVALNAASYFFDWGWTFY